MHRLLIACLLCLLALPVLFPCRAGARGQAPSRPNIVFIFADDLGWKDVGYQGSDFYETPVIDRLAKKEGGEGNQTGPPSDPKGVFALTHKACAFIEKNRDKPFFVYLAHHGIHSPLQAQPDVLTKFKKKAPGKEHKSAKYAACLAALDSSVDILLQKLKALGLEKNTIVVLTSDNGATPQSSQEPLRGNKGGYYEGGIREPLIIRWPGVTKPGSLCPTPVIHVDFFPTFLEVAQAKPPKPLDGESLVPLLKGDTRLKRQAIFWHFPGYLNDPVLRGRDKDFRTRPVSVIRKGDWRLHLYHEEWVLDNGKNALELYNIKDDIGERINLADTNPAKRDELLKDLLTWMKATNAPLAGKK